MGDSKTSERQDRFACNRPRRETIKRCAGAMAGLLVAPALGAATDDPARARPAPGDALAYMTGEHQGERIRLADLKVGEGPVLAYPMDVAKKVVRDGARTNLLVLLRVAPDQVPSDIASEAASGVLAFSAICTHYGCPVTKLGDNGTSLVCNCHGSTFDALRNGEVVKGPAVRRLARMPLALAEGEPVIAGDFNGRLGPPKQ